MTPTLIKPSAAEWDGGLQIQSDGDSDTWTDPDGTFRYVVSVHHDVDARINDYESDGKTSEFCYDYRNERDTPRPDGFTGRAMKLQVDRGCWMWWEPYDDLYGYQDADGKWLSAKWGDLPQGERSKQIARVQDILSDGFVWVDLVKQTKCSMDHWHDVETASLWGIDSLGNGYAAEVVNQLIGELE